MGGPKAEAAEQQRRAEFSICRPLLATDHRAFGRQARGSGGTAALLFSLARYGGVRGEKETSSRDLVCLACRVLLFLVVRGKKALASLFPTSDSRGSPVTSGSDRTRTVLSLVDRVGRTKGSVCHQADQRRSCARQDRMYGLRAASSWPRGRNLPQSLTDAAFLGTEQGCRIADPYSALEAMSAAAAFRVSCLPAWRLARASALLAGRRACVAMACSPLPNAVGCRGELALAYPARLRKQPLCVVDICDRSPSLNDLPRLFSGMACMRTTAPIQPGGHEQQRCAARLWSFSDFHMLPHI